jgi:putative peptidoglycan lipid II flippase
MLNKKLCQRGKFYDINYIRIYTVFSAIIIGVLISQADSLNILGTYSLAGYALSALLMIFLLFKIKKKTEGKIKNEKEDIKNYIIYLAPVCLNIFIYQIVYYFDRNIASTLSAGSISILFYTQNIIQIITGVLFFIITLSLLSMRKNIAKNNMKSAQESMITNTNNIILVFVPVSMFIICFAGPIVMGLFERGAFTGTNRLLASRILIAYALGILPIGLKFILDNIYFSFSDRKTPIIASAIAIILNIGLDFLLVIPLKLFGIALASAISYIIAAALMTFKLKNKVDADKIVLAVKNMLKVLFSAIPISIVTLIIFSAIFYSMTSTLAHIILCMLSAAIIFVLGYRYTLKHICDDVDLRVNIKSLKKKEIIYYPSAVTATGMDIGYEIIKDVKYSEKQRIRLNDIINLKYIKKAIQAKFVHKMIDTDKKFFKETIPQYYNKAKNSIYNTIRDLVLFIKNKILNRKKKIINILIKLKKGIGFKEKQFFFYLYGNDFKLNRN